jgi:hypothetical protein
MASSAERQAKYRQSKRQATDMASKRLDCWLPVEAHFALARLARHQGKTKAQVLEALILSADYAEKKACATDEDFEAYLGVTR